MAKKALLLTLYKQLPFLLLLGTPLIAFIAFSSINIFWITDAYDSWRIFEVILLIGLSTYIFFHQNKTTIFTKNIHSYLGYGLFATIIMILISAFYSKYPDRALADASLYGLLALSVLAQAQLFKQKNNITEKIAAAIAVLPILTIIFLLINIEQTIQTSEQNVWHQSFNNIRMLDDALLPCLFLLWQRPAWLSTSISKKSARNFITTCTVYLLSIAYLLVFFFDGARAGFLSVIIGLSFIVCFRRDQWKNLQLPFFSLFTSGIIYTSLIHFFPALLSVTLVRTDSSNRNLLWQKAWDLWLTKPLLGIGGDNFGLAQPWIISAHPHNIFIQFTSEWGIGGLLALLCLLPTAILIFRHIKTLPAFAFAATIAITIDSSISGILIYPLSQLLSLWPMALLIASLPTHSLNNLSHTTQKRGISQSFTVATPIHQIAIRFLAIISIFIMIVIHGRDITCVRCESIDAFSAPRFWLQGRATHLTPEIQMPKETSK